LAADAHALPPMAAAVPTLPPLAAADEHALPPMAADAPGEEPVPEALAKSTTAKVEVPVADRADIDEPKQAPEAAIEPLEANLASTRHANTLDAPAAIDPQPEAAAPKSEATIRHNAPTPPPTAANQDARAVHESELLADHAKISIGSIFTRADVPTANLREAIDPTRINDCYRAVLLLGTRPRSTFDGWLDLTTNAAGHVAEASMRGTRLPAELRSCIEHVARTSRVVAPNAASIQVSYPITFQMP
jgi:hypothetical protein